MAAGITGNVTGCRADIIIYDDVEVPNTCDGMVKRENLRARLKETNFILTPNGTQLFVGTPHSYFSIYAGTPRQEINEEEIFLKDFKRLEVPILDEHGKSVWSERYSIETINEMRKQSGPQQFQSQMMLQPVNVVDARLDTSLLQFYDNELSYSEAQQRAYLSLKDKKIMSCSAWWDPSFGGVKSDGSVLAIVFTDDEGNHYLHDVIYITVSAKDNEDEATLQCEIIADIAKKYYIPSISIETNGIGKFLPAILRRELGTRNIPTAVLEKTSTCAKSERIIEAFDVTLAAKKLFVHERVKKTYFLTEMMEWQPHHRYARDDGLDAVAGALLSEPVRIDRVYASQSQSWSKGQSQHSANSDFDI